MDNGWIKLHRKMMEWEWYTEPLTAHLFIHLLLSANSKDGKWKGMDVKRGELITGRAKLSKETGLTTNEVRKRLKRLQESGEISVKSTSKMTIVTICNYDSYQSQGEGVAPTKHQQSTNKAPTKHQQSTSKNGQLTPSVTGGNELTTGDEAPTKHQQSTNKAPTKHQQSTSKNGQLTPSVTGGNELTTGDEAPTNNMCKVPKKEKKEITPLFSPLSFPPETLLSYPPIIPPKKEKKETPPKEKLPLGSKKEIPPKATTSRFFPPTVEEVKQYCDGRNNGVSPEQFIDFYSSKGWMVGKNKMKDWKAAVRTWERRNREQDKSKQNRYDDRYGLLHFDSESDTSGASVEATL